jgi:hypothetical protein
MQKIESEAAAGRELFTWERSWRTRGEALAKVALYLIASTFLDFFTSNRFRPCSLCLFLSP